MSSKRNHKIRSRKTYKTRLAAAQMCLTGSIPFHAMQQLQMARKGGANK